MMRSLTIAAFLLLSTSGCVTYQRGVIDVAAAVPPPIAMTTIADRVEGRSCGSWVERQYEYAADDALSKAPGANALVDVVYRFERFCIVVQGRAVKLGPP